MAGASHTFTYRSHIEPDIPASLSATPWPSGTSGRKTHPFNLVVCPKMGISHFHTWLCPNGHRGSRGCYGPMAELSSFSRFLENTTQGSPSRLPGGTLNPKQSLGHPNVIRPAAGSRQPCLHSPCQSGLQQHPDLSIIIGRRRFLGRLHLFPDLFQFEHHLLDLHDFPGYDNGLPALGKVRG